MRYGTGPVEQVLKYILFLYTPATPVPEATALTTKTHAEAAPTAIESTATASDATAFKATTPTSPLQKAAMPLQCYCRYHAHLWTIMLSKTNQNGNVEM